MTDPMNPEPPMPEVDAGDLVGRVLAGRYRVLRRLGVGAMGAVYVAEHTRIGRRDAIKVLRAAMARDPEAIARFTRGARNVSRIRHPNVCTLYDFGNTEEGFHFLAMEFVDGLTLGSLLEEEGPLPAHRAADLIGQVGEALQAAHTLGIIHRDLKPDNIMVARTADGGEQIKVVDFDIARGPAEEEGPAVTRHGFVVGTPEYMSPEQLTGDPLDGRSDIYSMALVLFRMLTGRLPFEGETAQEIMVQRLTREPMGLGEATGQAFPTALEAAVAWGLKRKAEDRPRDARTFVTEVKQALEGAETTTPVAPTPMASSAVGGTGGAAIPPTRIPSSADRADSLGAPVTATTVSSAPASAPPTGPDTSAGGGRRGSPLVMGAAALVALLLVGGGAALWLTAGEESPPVEVASSMETDPTPQGAVGDEPAETVVAGAAEPDGTTDGQPGDRPSPEPAPAPPSATETTPDPQPRVTPEATTLPTTPAEDAPTDPQPAPPSLEAGEVRDILLRHFAAINDTPSRVTAEAARDTAGIAWGTPDVSNIDRALAAWVNGQSLLILGDSIQGVQWLDRAVGTHPQPPAGWVGELELHRSRPQ
ncbi:MAG: serine/threonine protein kinase [Gemmatimonadales bacterium]|nr:MAG: serine/threonine protein kinase [Gemmatimonadales bacterium]